MNDRNQEIVQERLAALREATADRPAHAAWLEECIAWEFASPRPDPATAPDPAGRAELSWRVAVTIESEVAYLHILSRRVDNAGVARPDRYESLRRADAARAVGAARTRAERRRAPLGVLLPGSGGKDGAS